MGSSYIYVLLIPDSNENQIISNVQFENIFTQSFWNIWSWIKILCRSSVNDASLVRNSFYLLQETHHETYPLLKEWKMTSTFYLPE